MENRLTLSGLILGISFLVACSPNKFSISSDCKASATASCVSANGESQYSGSFTVKGGKVDILIVNDNSASMSYEQRQLATRFGNLLSLMDGRYIDYRIAMTTTDISSAKNPARSVNLNGALQDGKLITFAGGQSYLSSEVGTANSRSTAFAQAIQRPETLSCETFVLNWKQSGKSTETAEYTASYSAACPSTDERGIYAARLSLESASFLRKDADLSIIFLADEDVRSQLYWYNTAGYLLEDKDRAASLVSYIQKTFPQKKVGINSIVVTNATCLDEQSKQLQGAVSGSYGREYANASSATGGVIGNICAPDYTDTMNQVFSNITANLTDKIALACASPVGLKVYTSNGAAWTIQGSAVVFNQKLPGGTQVSFQYVCKAGAQ